MYTYTDLMCMNYICIVCRCIRHHYCFLSRHSAPTLTEMNKITNSGSRLRMSLWESLDDSARSPRSSMTPVRHGSYRIAGAQAEPNRKTIWRFSLTSRGG